MGNTNIVLATAKEYGYSEAQLEIIRQTAAVGCTDFEIAQFLIVARRTGLDPMVRQIYMVKRWNKAAGRDIATAQTGIDGYRLVADRTERYAPGREPTFQYDTEGNLYSATAYIKKLVGGAWHEIAATAIWEEYKQMDSKGNLTMMWRKMPHLMLGKCAEALALRRAFPAELSGIYTADEMAQADNPDIIEAAAVKIESVPPTPAPQPTPTAAVPKSEGMQLSTWGRLNGLCVKRFGDEWQDVERRRKFALYVSDNHTADIMNLLESEAQAAIDGLEKKLAEMKAAAEASPVPA